MLLKDKVLSEIDLLMKQGVMGRKKQIATCLSQEENSAYNVNRNKYREFYQQISTQYTEIRLHNLWSTRLGEYVARYILAVDDSEKNAQQGILDVFVLSDCINKNSRLMEIMKRKIHIIDETNIEMWRYVLFHFSKVEFNKYWDIYAARNSVNNVRALDPGITVRYFELTASEQKEGEYKKRLMNLKMPYICVTSRDAGYLDAILPKLNRHYKYLNYRDSDINYFHVSAEYLLQKGITMVRMGRYMKNRVNFGNCIDYAIDYYDEFMDIFLIMGCKFFVGDTNGICSLAMSFNKPVALKNYFPFLMDTWGALPQNKHNILIFKKYYKTKESRFLSLEEMFNLEAKSNVINNARNFQRLGIEVVENSAEEICDLVKEMNARIDGEWEETAEDIALQNEYQSIFRKWCKRMNYSKNAVYQGRIGAMFLRKNKFLLGKQ